MHDKFTMPMTIAAFIVTYKVTICPFLFSLSVLFIIDPRALIDCLISAHELALTMLCVILPISDVIAAIRVNHPTKAIVLIARPVSIIAHPIRPYLGTFTVLLLSSPMASVQGTILDLCLFSFKSMYVRVDQHSFASHISILEFSKLAEYLFNLWIVVGIDSVPKLRAIDFLKAEPISKVIW